MIPLVDSPRTSGPSIRIGFIVASEIILGIKRRHLKHWIRGAVESARWSVATTRREFAIDRKERRPAGIGMSQAKRDGEAGKIEATKSAQTRRYTRRLFTNITYNFREQNQGIGS